MSTGGGEGFEVLGYVVFFWGFLFSKKFRQAQIEEWKESGVFGKFCIILEAISSILCGFGLPILILYWIFFE